MIDGDEIYEKAASRKTDDRQEAARLLAGSFSKLSDKNRAWDCLHRLTKDEDDIVRVEAAHAIGSVFLHLPDSILAYGDLQRLAMDQEEDVRWITAFAFGLAFANFPDKTQGWKDLRRLTQDPAIMVQFIAIKSLGLAFAHIPDKNLAWSDLHRLAENPNGLIRQITSYAIGFAFPYLPDKDKAWEDIHSLSWDPILDVKEMAASAIGFAFGYVSNKDQAYDDLQRLALDQYPGVRSMAAYSIGSAFVHISDKHEALNDLHLLSYDIDKGVRAAIAYTIGYNFSHLTDREQACKDLQMLSQDIDERVRAVAYHSLGNASVFNATEAKDIDCLKGVLVSAIDHFEKSSQQESGYNPAAFCLPFYRTYLTITFQDAKESEVQKYIAEAREAVGSSESKDELLKAVENLAGALQESQRLKDRSVQEIANELNTYRWYCEKAAEYMAAAEDKAPGAVKLMRRCNPLLEDKIQATIAEIQEKARLISPEVDRAARCLSLGDPIKGHQCCMRMASILRDSCKRLPDEKRELTCGILIDIEKDEELSVVLGKIELAMAYILPEIEAERKEILERLKNIEFSMARLNLSSGSARQDLFELKTIIKNFQAKTEARGLSMEELNKVLSERDNTMIERLQKMKEDWLQSVEDMVQSLPSCDENAEILKEIQSLKQSRKRDVLGITGDISSIAGLLVGLIGLVVTMKPA